MYQEHRCWPACRATTPTAIEFGRKVLFSDVRPGFLELEAHVKGKA